MDPIDLDMIRGDTLELEVEFTDNVGRLIDDNGAVYRMTAKYNDTDPDPGVFSVTASQIGPGVALIQVDPDKTIDLPASFLGLHYDIQVTETSGRVTTIQWGTLKVIPDVTVTTP